MTGSRRCLGVLFGMLGVLIASSTQAGQESPVDVVERLHAKLIDVMKSADQLGCSGRYAELAPVIHDNFNLPFMVKSAVGPHWRSLENGQKLKVLESFTGLTISTYASRFDGYSGERFHTVEQAPGPRNTVIVRTYLQKTDGDKIELDYLLRPSEEKPQGQIIDVFLDGAISEMATRRSEYGAVLQNDGIDALIERLTEKIEEANCAAAS